ncbi:MAG: thiosulfate oxidation carrier complex protein SoxZ [Sulfurimonas sp. RIFCSPLOWO2_12_FULL_36_74]|uniref:thiosulfate oxidation carrier complex protein SoxZ n=1 Tax=Sulfurimonas sp. RIFCSPLOWO2_12_36_12 TaxID=1802253 RepID=UPI0008AACF51|nr:thiosulfate oxidation carrier complex protein SoxZ [Sulfurimonas sp. RIFCSPLOWO2_12_36_12]OHD98635.1 MAG: thiosulfate oxidation carrier complex protein SoxZ [Sulfurimonas sp. RIFCSPLOWO2_02_FULL_36_28]OHE00602.1 MAG: thiosulfate oxidation carrier complex protein SoxZ [Sulfurimonas sp. RIFCSPLOWO2_12_36_12]OHE05623.1 MAG: thiosulfate oxidation carrier complex protein SoxZ [Sulfurimonas sp. RIFCSPLOWO2_12_FULL_36_74]
MKIKAKIKDNVTEVKLLLSNPMVGKEEAALKKIDVSYITHVTAKVGGKIVWEASTGPFLSKDPYFMFNFKGAKAGDEIVVDTIDDKGKTETDKEVIK